MIPARISNPTTSLQRPDNWNEAASGQCLGLPVRLEKIDGIMFMRSAWEIEPGEALDLAAGGKLVLGVSAPKHPVIHMKVEPAPQQLTRVTLVRELIDSRGDLTVLVETLFPPAPTDDDEQPPGESQRAHCREAVGLGGAPVAVHRAMVEIEQYAVRQGWIPA